MPLDPTDRRPMYVQVAEDLRRAISSGEREPGERLPAVRTLAKDYGVANATAARAIESLQRDGLVISRAGRGTVITKKPVSPGSVQEQLDDLRSRVKALEAERGKT